MKQKKAVFFDSHLSHGQIGYSITKEDKVPAGICLSEKDLKSFINKTEKSIINWFLLIKGGIKDMATYYVVNKFGGDYEATEFDGYWYKIPVSEDNATVPAVMLFKDNKTGKSFVQYAIIRDER